MLTLKPSDFRPAHKNQFNFEHTQKTSQSIPRLNTSHFRPAHKKQSISIHTSKSSNFGPHTKNKSILTPAQKTCQFRSPHLNQVYFNPARENQGNFDPITKIKPISIPALISTRFRCRDTKTELISIQMLKASHFRPPHKNQFNSDPYSELKSIWTTHATTISISSVH